MESPSALRPSRPQSAKELVEKAKFNFDPSIPMKYWTRTAETIYQAASFSMRDADYGRAYMMFYRYSHLVMNDMPTHPQFKKSRADFEPLRDRLNTVIPELERLKPEIDLAYHEWKRRAPPVDASFRTRYDEYAAQDPSMSGNTRILDASTNQDLAVDLAQRELVRRDTARRATIQAGIKDEDVISRRMGGRWDSWDSQGRRGEDVDLQLQMEATRQALDAADQRRRVDSDHRTPTASSYNYPSISRHKAVDFEPPRYPAHAPPRPARPPKEPERPARDDLRGPPSAPAIPRKVPLMQYEALIPTPPPKGRDGPSLPPKEELPPETPLPAPKKERLTFQPSAYLENGDPIRSLFLPRQLRHKFLEIAESNTRRGLEMCGILCGTPINNALFVRCLLIPDQKCTSDTCETENETSMFDYCIQEDLLVLGWIHTHPTQTCFMSSRDLHTQSGYQVMMPESVAIVCSPKFNPDYGIFRLTHPPGLDLILKCHREETFHQHDVPRGEILCREAGRPDGHVYETDKLEFYVHDLRTKKT